MTTIKSLGRILLVLPVLTLCAFSDISGGTETIRHPAPIMYKDKILYLQIMKTSFKPHYYDFIDLNATLAIPALSGVITHRGLRNFAEALKQLSNEQLEKLSELYDLSDPPKQNITDIMKDKNTQFAEYMEHFIDVLKTLRNSYDMDVVYNKHNETGRINCPCQLCVKNDIVCIATNASFLSHLGA